MFFHKERTITTITFSFKKNKVSYSLVKTEIDELKRNNGLKLKKETERFNCY